MLRRWLARGLEVLTSSLGMKDAQRRIRMNRVNCKVVIEGCTKWGQLAAKLKHKEENTRPREVRDCPLTVLLASLGGSSCMYFVFLIMRDISQGKNIRMRYSPS